MHRHYAGWEADKGMIEKAGMNTKSGSQKKIVYGIIALVCFLLLFGITFKKRQQEQSPYSCAIVVLGDSILGQIRDDTSVAARLEDLLGKPVYNGALGGTCMSRNDLEMRLGYTKDCLSVTALVEAIATRDFGVQQTIRSRENGTQHFGNIIDDLCVMDFDEVEIVIIGAGVNDYHAGTPIFPENEDYDAYNEYTYVGALRSAIRDLQKAYPHLRIVLMTPTYTWYREKNMTCEEYNLGGGLLEQYVEAERQVAAEMEVEFIDLYHNFYPNRQWEDWELYTIDGLHPNEAGRALIAEKIADYLRGNDT